MNDQAKVGNAVHRALELVGEYGPLDMVIRSLEGRYGRGSYEKIWRRITGDETLPTYSFEQAVVHKLLLLETDIKDATL